jgi:hypothetical protein
MCYGLTGVLEPKRGQIAHLDRNRTNSRIRNLAYLCLGCHTEYDSKSNRALRITPGEIIAYRAKLYKALNQNQIEWIIAARIDRSQYDSAKPCVEAALAVLRQCVPDTKLSETPIE